MVLGHTYQQRSDREGERARESETKRTRSVIESLNRSLKPTCQRSTGNSLERKVTKSPSLLPFRHIECRTYPEDPDVTSQQKVWEGVLLFQGTDASKTHPQIGLQTGNYEH